MRKYLIGAIALAVLALGSAALAAPGSGNRLYCFSGTEDGYNGTCTLSGSGAVLDTTDGNGNPNDNYAGVYVGNSKLEGRLLGDVQKLSFSYRAARSPAARRGSASRSTRTGTGRPRRTRSSTRSAATTARATSMSIDDASCLVSYGATTYANWAAFVAANPTLPDRLRRAHVHHRRPARRLRAHERRAAAEAR